MKKYSIFNIKISKIIRSVERKGSKVFALAIACFVAGISCGVLWEEQNGAGFWYSQHMPIDKINICFTPPSGCGSLIAREIKKAKHTVYVQAYGLTFEPIINQLIAAHKRGVNVQIILDGGNLSNNQKILEIFVKQGIWIASDIMPRGIAHNKVIIIDKKTLITGSFNFTRAADRRNAENVIAINDQIIAERYLANWKSRAAHARIYESKK